MVWGVLTTLIGVSTLSLGIAAAALISSGRAGASPIAARVTAATASSTPAVWKMRITSPSKCTARGRG